MDWTQASPLELIVFGEGVFTTCLLLVGIIGALAWCIYDFARRKVAHIKRRRMTTRWYELFGTPERTARTLLYVLNCKDSRPWVSCDSCPILDGCKIRGGDCDAILEWLRRSDVE